ncbi:MAG: hypothetical protein IKZ37_09055 [Bacteroidaceae bacterium]|nr:hypothetical protein [Bacteroidaceae bacterium]
MKKKDYISPATELIEVSTVKMLSTSRIPIGGESGSFDAPKQRGEWGNFWKQ